MIYCLFKLQNEIGRLLIIIITFIGHILNIKQMNVDHMMKEKYNTFTTSINRLHIMLELNY